jgi:hypothetical protein
MRLHYLLLLSFLEVTGCNVGLRNYDDGVDASVAIDANMSVQCVGLACNQVSCNNGGSTTVSGTVTAPNGKDPVYQAVVYVPITVTKFPPTIQCEVCDETLGGTALVSTMTAIDGTFTLQNVPATSQVPIVVQKGRFRRTVSISVPPCQNTPLTADQARLPKNQQEGDLPHIAVGVSDFDQIECVLHSIGIDQAEFTSPTGSGAVHLYANSDSITGQPTMHSLLLDPTKMSNYQLIFIGCAVPTFAALGDGPTVTTNLFNYVNTGGRLYVTDYSYDYMEQVSQFSPYVFFSGGGNMTMPQPPGAAESTWDGQTFTATVGDPNLAQWLKIVGKSTNGQIPIEAAYALAVSTASDQKSYPSTTWVHGPVQGLDTTDRPHTVTFDYNMCGKVLWSAYHTREPGGASQFGTFPQYCLSNPTDPSTMIAQEKILEFLVFEISACVNNVPG